jgi:hypothetical protein
MRIALLCLALAACAPEVRTIPVMAPVDHPPAPKGISIKCSVDFPPIHLPATAEQLAAGQRQDREIAQAAIDTCNSRRVRAVEHIRRLGATR